MISGKQIRKNKILSKTGSVFLALDHGFAMGPIKGMENLNSLISQLSEIKIDSIILNYGALKNMDIESLNDCRTPLIVHLTGSDITQGGAEKEIIYRPIDAIKMGADAVSVQLNFGTDTEQNQIKQIASVIRQSDELGLPVLLMMYDKSNTNDYPDRLKKMVRLGLEIGADLIKIDIKNDLSLLREICLNSPVPILVAGGSLEKTEEDFHQKIKTYIDAGASGVSVGRNVFQSDNPKKTLDDICNIFHEKTK
ncbi:MAG: hypothetical protein WC087_02700 [Candidatus Paceibacterota bacterium]